MHSIVHLIGTIKISRNTLSDALCRLIPYLCEYELFLDSVAKVIKIWPANPTSGHLSYRKIEVDLKTFNAEVLENSRKEDWIVVHCIVFILITEHFLALKNIEVGLLDSQLEKCPWLRAKSKISGWYGWSEPILVKYE